MCIYVLRRILPKEIQDESKVDSSRLKPRISLVVVTYLERDESQGTACSYV